MELVVNDWFLDYFRYNKESSVINNNRIKVVNFLDAIIQKGDKIVIRRQSPWTEKFESYQREAIAEGSNNTKANFKVLLEMIFHNNEVCRIIDKEEIIKLSEEIEKDISENHLSLLELANSTQDKIFITTNSELKEKLKNQSQIKVYLLEEFIEDYCKNY